jgi:dTDP-4-amino-4,6-dideoxygalactose transaminase
MTYRASLINFLRLPRVSAVFHYQSLHASEFYIDKHDGRKLSNSDRYSDCLLRLPLFNELTVA